MVKNKAKNINNFITYLSLLSPYYNSIIFINEFQIYFSLISTITDTIKLKILIIGHMVINFCINYPHYIFDFILDFIPVI